MKKLTAGLVLLIAVLFGASSFVPADAAQPVHNDKPFWDSN